MIFRLLVIPGHVLALGLHPSAEVADDQSLARSFTYFLALHAFCRFLVLHSPTVIFRLHQ